MDNTERKRKRISGGEPYELTMGENTPMDPNSPFFIEQEDLAWFDEILNKDVVIYPPDYRTLKMSQTSVEGRFNIIHEKHTDNFARLERVKLWQQTSPLPFPPDVFFQLNEELTHISHVVWENKNELEQIFTSEVLLPSTLALYERLTADIKIQEVLLRLYEEELKALYANPSSTLPFAALVITKCPFPRAIKNKTPLIEKDDFTVVQLYASPRTEFRASKVVAFLVSEDGSKLTSKKGGKNEVTIVNYEQLMDAKGVTTFPELKFPQGTRLAPVRVQFLAKLSLKINNHISELTLETDSPSPPFVVITNENQWQAAEKSLISSELFDHGNSVNWCKFANLLQIHYTRATRQSLAAPLRPLSCKDLQYIKLKFFSKGEVHAQDFNAFWQHWFGIILSKIRHTKVLAKMWVDGYIYGFATKEEAKNLLALSDHPNSFLFRFSEQKPNKLAVAYSSAGAVSHSLVEKDDELLEFMAIRPNLFRLIARKLDNNNNFSYYGTDGNSLADEVTLIDKDLILQNYHAKIEEKLDPVGYVPMQ